MSSGRTATRLAATRLVRRQEYVDPPLAVRREVLTAGPQAGVAGVPPPVLLVPGLGHGAWAYAEHWLAAFADRGFPVAAMSLRGHAGSDGAGGVGGGVGSDGAGGDGGSGGVGSAGRHSAGHGGLRGYVEDVVQVAAALPRQAVLIGNGVGALVVAMAMARYPARAAVLASPVFGGLGTAMTMARRHPSGALAAVLNRPVPAGHRQLFGPGMPPESAGRYVDRLDRGSPRVYRQLIRRQVPERPVGDPPVLVVGSPDDRVVPRAELDRVAQRYGGAPLLFPGMAHDLMLDERWAEPVEALLEWLVARCWPGRDG